MNKTTVKKHVRRRRGGLSIIRRHTRKIKRRYRENTPPPIPTLDVDWEEIVNDALQEKAYRRTTKRDVRERAEKKLEKQKSFEEKLSTAIPVLAVKLEKGHDFIDYEKKIGGKYGTGIPKFGAEILDKDESGRPITKVIPPPSNIEANKELARRVIQGWNEHPYSALSNKRIVAAKIIYRKPATTEEISEETAKKLESLTEGNDLLASIIGGVLKQKEQNKKVIRKIHATDLELPED